MHKLIINQSSEAYQRGLRNGRNCSPPFVFRYDDAPAGQYVWGYEDVPGESARTPYYAENYIAGYEAGLGIGEQPN